MANSEENIHLKMAIESSKTLISSANETKSKMAKWRKLSAKENGESGEIGSSQAAASKAEEVKIEARNGGIGAENR